MKTKIFIGILGGVLFTGCFNTQPNITSNMYFNSSIQNEDEKNLKFEEDKLFCELYTYEKVPNTLPSNNYNNNSNGTFQIRNTSTGVVHQGSYNNNQAINDNVSWDVYQRSANKDIKLKYFNYCMMQKGWRLNN
ncbi:MAG TPA: hypothetical protein K8U92_07360 [Aliarcobacter thereius]|nr:hypothetical protein [Aliarcobacter thereius]HJE03679.1 hypothetical protein [Aliarcobacter thereius]